MKKQILDDWIVALRSGEFKQAQGRLKKDGGFCCLGVVCHLQDPNGFFSAGGLKDGQHPFAMLENSSEYGGLIKMLGHDTTSTLVSMNDSRRASFAEIADYLEANRVAIEALG